MPTSLSRKYLAVALLCALCAIHIAAALYLQRAVSADAVPIGGVIPPIKGISLDGQPFVQNNMETRKLALLFFTPTCVHCKEELENVEKLRPRYLGSLTFLAISLGNPELTRSVAYELHLGFPVIIDSRAELNKPLNIHVVPAMFLVDESHILRQQFVGKHSLTDIEQFLDHFVADMPSR